MAVRKKRSATRNKLAAVSRTEDKYAKKEVLQRRFQQVVYSYGAFFFCSLAIVIGSYLKRKEKTTTYSAAPIIENNSKEMIQTEDKLRALFDVACHPQTAGCSNAIEVVGRSMKNKFAVPNGGLQLFELKRSMQIWDIDALRDPFVRKHLIPARRVGSDVNLPTIAYLAAYLALHRGKGNRPSVEQAYLDYLPTHEEYASFHPILMDHEYLASRLGAHSYALQLVKDQKENIESEYNAFANVSPEFTSLITLQEYTVAKINVISRAFTTAGLQPGDLLPEEEELYQTVFGTLENVGKEALVPLLDSWDHHATNPTAIWKFDPATKSYLVFSKGPMQKGWELFTSYGSHPDPHMFAVYGFVNGDGSSPLLGSIASFHDANPNETARGQELLRYLAYDDGYDACIERGKSPSQESEFKSLKFKILQLISHDPSYWIVTFPAMHEDAMPRQASDPEPLDYAPPSFDNRVRFDGSLLRVLSTSCRLLALTHRDYNGHATSKLKSLLLGMKYLGKYKFELEEGDEALEFRSTAWLQRLSMMELNKYGSSVEQQMEKVSKFDQEFFHSTEWTLAHVRLGEMQVLQMLERYAGQRMDERQIPDPPSSDYILREYPCPMSNSDYLLE